MMKLPVLEEYDLSPVTGFLPDEHPLETLTSKYYAPWERLAKNLPSLILTKRVRAQVDKMPVLEIKQLGDDKRELRRAYSILCFLAHAYVWGVDLPKDRLPSCIAKPLLGISQILEVPPVATYASVVLWNFKTILEDEEEGDKSEVYNLDNISTISTYTGSIDESWFYLVSVYFEKNGASCLTTGLDTLQGIREDNIVKVTKSLQKLAESIDLLGSVLMRMEEMCDPHTFYYRIRPYLAGWSNMADAGLPHGLRYGEEEEYRSYAGGSNAQSSLIQALDIFLNVEHYPTGKKPTKYNDGASISSNSNQNNFMNEMRNYMPGPHRRFLEHLAQVSNTREYVSSKNNNDLTLAYDACLAMLKAFRDKHIQIVTRYIILQAKLYKQSGSSNTLRSGISKTAEKKEQKGTGGTSLIPFLKQCRDETGDPAASEWGKKMLSSGVLSTKHASSTEPERAAKRQKLGMAGDWETSGEEQGGHW